MADDGMLIKRIQEGQRDSLDTLIERYYPDILRYCLWHTKNRQEAEDATQTTFLRVCAHLKQYRHAGQFRAWVYAIARNACADSHRQRTADALDEATPVHERGYAEAEARLGFEALLAPLPEAQRELLWLRYAQGLKLREVAEVLALPTRTVQSRLRAALRTVKADIRKGDFFDA